MMFMVHIVVFYMMKVELFSLKERHKARTVKLQHYLTEMGSIRTVPLTGSCKSGPNMERMLLIVVPLTPLTK